MIFLGIADLLSAGVLWLRAFQFNLPIFLIVIFAGYLLVKILLFGINLAGLADLLAAGLLIASIFMIFPVGIFPLVSGFLALKGAQSIFASLI